VAVVVLEILHQERYFAFAALLASLGFSITLSLINVDASIVKHNVPRALQGKNINLIHLMSLSTDAVPPLVDEFLSPAYSEADHQRLGAILVCYLHYQSISYDPKQDWRSFNLSRWQAQRALDKIQAQLQEYGINDDPPRVRARTPGNVYYVCGENKEGSGLLTESN
jgi:hypothetical protein